MTNSCLTHRHIIRPQLENTFKIHFRTCWNLRIPYLGHNYVQRVCEIHVISRTWFWARPLRLLTLHAHCNPVVMAFHCPLVYVHIPLWRCEILATQFPSWDYRFCWKKKYCLSIRTPNDQMDWILNHQFPMRKTATGILCFLAEFSYYEGHLLKVQTRPTRSRGIRNARGFQWDHHFTWMLEYQALKLQIPPILLSQWETNLLRCITVI